MKQYYAADLKPQTEVTDFFMIKSAGIKVGSNKKQYFDVLLGDKTGEVNSKKWDISEAELPTLQAMKEGDIINVDVSTIYNGYFADSSRMFCIGNVSAEKKRLVDIAKQSLEVGLAEVRPWQPLGKELSTHKTAHSISESNWLLLLS